mmetsp:Transcript_2685/g.5968  ORF Transcript_2685/g.5968 Transcript_2685/m.5968 type:complete len:220 (-) Transcript_2685:272-931(-)
MRCTSPVSMWATGQAARTRCVSDDSSRCSMHSHGQASCISPSSYSTITASQGLCGQAELALRIPTTFPAYGSNVYRPSSCWYCLQGTETLTPSHPQTQGCSERMNRSVGTRKSGSSQSRRVTVKVSSGAAWRVDRGSVKTTVYPPWAVNAYLAGTRTTASVRMALTATQVFHSLLLLGRAYCRSRTSHSTRGHFEGKATQGGELDSLKTSSHSACPCGK